MISLAATGGANMDQHVEIKIDVIGENCCHFQTQWPQITQEQVLNLRQ